MSELRFHRDRRNELDNSTDDNNNNDDDIRTSKYTYTHTNKIPKLIPLLLLRKREKRDEKPTINDNETDCRQFTLHLHFKCFEHIFLRLLKVVCTGAMYGFGKCNIHGQQQQQRGKSANIPKKEANIEIKNIMPADGCNFVRTQKHSPKFALHAQANAPMTSSQCYVTATSAFEM